MVGRVHPGGVPYSVKYPEIPAYGFLENSARKFPDRSAAIYVGNRISYSRLWRDSLRFAAVLRKLGVKQGDPVGLILPNTPHFMVAYNGTLMAGNIVVPLNPLNPVKEIERELSDSGCKVLVVLDRLLEKLPGKRPQNLIVAEAASYAPTHLHLLSRIKYRSKYPSDSLRFEEIIKGDPLKQLSQVNPKEDVACILYTTGTTGTPKGVMLTHYNQVANALQSYYWLRGWGYSAKPQPEGWPLILCAVPWFHSYGLNIMNEAVSFGCTLVIIPDPKPKTILNAISKHRVTHAPLIPRFVREILEHPDLPKYNLRSLNAASSGGSSINPDLMKRFEEIAGCRFYQGYGLTEAGPITHATPLEGDPNYASVGLPYPDTEYRVVDIKLGEVEMPEGKEGELQVKGPQVMKGYLNAPDETMEVLKDGWLNTGDVVRVDSDGWLYIIGRKRDRIITAGRTIWPGIIEEILRSHPDVEEAVAIGAPDPLRCSTEVHAFVVPKKGSKVEGLTLELKAYATTKLEPYGYN
jgi:long-chain acyl-CoA synthetase